MSREDLLKPLGSVVQVVHRTTMPHLRGTIHSLDIVSLHIYYNNYGGQVTVKCLVLIK